MRLLILTLLLLWTSSAIASTARDQSLEHKPKNTEISKRDTSKRSKSRRSNEPIPIKIETISAQDRPRLISILAPLSGRKQVDLYPKVTGRISQIGPDEGSKVRVGDVLFKVDRSDPGESFLSAPVTSPINGWIGRWYINNIGEQVTSNEAVVTVVDDEFLRATIYLSTTDWVEISHQAKIKISIEDTVRTANIISIARVADIASGRGSLQVEVENSDHQWRAGMIARVSIELDMRPRMILTAAALNITDEGSYVYVVKSDKAIRTNVTYRLLDNDTIEILSGLESGSNIVIAGGNLLTDGASVVIVPQENSGAY